MFGLDQALHHLVCMRTGKPMPYIIKAKWYTSGRFAVIAMAAEGIVHALMCIYFELSQFATSAPHVQQRENLKGKFIGPSLEALTKESCSDASDAENGLRLLLTETSPDGKAVSPLSAASTRLSSNTSLARVTAVSWIHQALVDHFTNPLA